MVKWEASCYEHSPTVWGGQVQWFLTSESASRTLIERLSRDANSTSLLIDLAQEVYREVYVDALDSAAWARRSTGLGISIRLGSLHSPQLGSPRRARLSARGFPSPDHPRQARMVDAAVEGLVHSEHELSHIASFPDAAHARGSDCVMLSVAR